MKITMYPRLYLNVLKTKIKDCPIIKIFLLHRYLEQICKNSQHLKTTYTLIDPGRRLPTPVRQVPPSTNGSWRTSRDSETPKP